MFSVKINYLQFKQLSCAFLDFRNNGRCHLKLNRQSHKQFIVNSLKETEKLKIISQETKVKKSYRFKTEL